jgi:murein DD-endopeptidase MepM/ murein hydrolase activator NlpD
MGTVGLDSGGNSATTAGGDLASLNKVSEQDQGMLQEESQLQNLTDLMNRSVGSLEKIASLFESHSKLLVELPTMWPVQGGVGRITTYFGPAIHPFTHQMYLHMGVDIAYRPGVPVVAAADGKVVEKRYEALGFGNYVVIRHRYGFYTKYAHMEQVYVHEGDEVKQGQMIGRMGSTGLSTGPHLHFEIRLGSEVVDPMRYLDINRESQAIPVSQD